MSDDDQGAGAAGEQRRAQAVAVFGDWLGTHVGDVTDEALLANDVAALIDGDSELLRLEDLEGALNVSARTIQRLTRRYVGVPPAAMIRRRRLQEAAGRVRAEPDLDLSALAADLGYADHAHLTNDFRAGARLHAQHLPARPHLGSTWSPEPDREHRVRAEVALSITDPAQPGWARRCLGSGGGEGDGLALDPQAKLGALGGDERVGVTDADDLPPRASAESRNRSAPRGQLKSDGALRAEVVGVDDDAADRPVLVDADLLGSEHELDAAPRVVGRQPHRSERARGGVAVDPGLEHDGVAEELRRGAVDRAGVDLERAVDLGEQTVAHHRDLVGEATAPRPGHG